MRKAKFIAVLFFTFLTACASESAQYSSNVANPSSPTYKSADTGDVSRSQEESPSTNPNNVTLNQVSPQTADQNQAQPTVIQRKIIRNADLQLESDAPEEAQQKITTIAESKGGFVVEVTQSSSNLKTRTRDTVTMTVRVPAEKFNESLDEIRRTGSRVILETVKGTDVTEEFIDIEARLKAKRALEEQFLEIMKRANSVQDALNVQKQLSDVRGEIEKIEGRKRFLENQASLSTIKIRLQTPAAFSQNSQGFFDRLGQSIGTGFDAALTFILGFVTFLIAALPFFLLIVLPIYLLLRYFWRKWRRRKSAIEIAREEIKNE